MFKLGTYLYIHNAGTGAMGCNGYSGIVVNQNEHIITNGLLNHEKGFLIKLDKTIVYGKFIMKALIMLIMK